VVSETAYKSFLLKVYSVKLQIFYQAKFAYQYTSHSRKNDGPFLVTIEKLLAKFRFVKIFGGGSYRSVVKALPWGVETTNEMIL
jgi:hypothetical protein